jgi:hypothetical protein
LKALMGFAVINLDLLVSPQFSVCIYLNHPFPGDGLAICGSSRCGYAIASGMDGDIYCFGSTTSQPRQPWTSCIGGAGATSCLGDSACSDNPGIVLWWV